MKLRLCVGNPVNCDCELRPLRQWLASQVAPDPEWGELLCSSPQFLEGQSVAVVSEDRMTCDAVRAGPRFEIKPDLTFRDIHRWVIKSERKLTFLYFSLQLPSVSLNVCNMFDNCSLQVRSSLYISNKSTNYRVAHEMSYYFIYLRSYDSCRRLPEPKHHSFLFNH
jgi:hypothetical protein